MSEKAVSAILQQPDTSTDMGKRDAFLMLFLYKTAARVQELVDVRIKDIQIGDSPRVILHGKGNKARVIPLRDDVVKHLEQYLLKFHADESQFSEDHLFFTVRGNAKKRMTEANVRSIVRKYGKMAREVCSEVPENVHPHLFRHSWAMALYQNGVELTLIANADAYVFPVPVAEISNARSSPCSRIFLKFAINLSCIEFGFNLYFSSDGISSLFAISR